MAFPSNPENGQISIVNNVNYQFSTTGNTWTKLTAGGITTGGNVNVSGAMLPITDVIFDLGSPTQRFRSLYLSGNTIDLGGATIKTDVTTGAVAIVPQVTDANPNPIGVVFTPTGATTTVATTGGTVSGEAIATASNSATAATSLLVSNVQVANSSYTVLDDTAVSTSGGYIVLTGSGFNSNSRVIVNTVNATSTTYVSPTVLRAQVPAQAAATYNLYVIDSATGATAIRVNGITYSAFPAWSTGSSLTTQLSAVSFGVNLAATSDSTITYANTSALPDGTALAANGYFYGTVTVTSATTYSIDVRATDAENQDTSRTFSLTVTIEPVLFMGGSAGIPAGTTTSATSNIGDSRTADKAFDNSLGEITQCYHSGSSPGTVTFSITFSQPRKIDVYRIIPRLGNDWKPNTWDLQGSNDNSTWTTVDSRSNQSSSIPDPAGQPLSTVLATGNYAEWTVANPGSYSYYRFLFYTGSQSYLVIGEIMFYSY